ncbi:MAG: sporulation protein YqfD [Lachnospiraceae bacterium]|nr:sporulation protein YqfD [Lachnospiraceae bacterium]
MGNVFGYVKGTLRIKLTGISPERFINLCSKSQIVLWNIVQVIDVFYLNIGLKDFYRIKPLLRKTGTKVIILERSGLPFFIAKTKRRKAFLAGLILCVAFWFISGLFIWRIDYNGNYAVTSDMLEKALKNQGIAIGRLKSKADLLEANTRIRQEFQEITWIGMGFQGTTLQVNIKEKKQEIQQGEIVIQDYENRLPSGGEEGDAIYESIYAPEEGVILSIIVRSGIPMVKKGDTVIKDQVLVDGLVPIMNEDGTVKEYMQVTPDADILLEYYLYESFTLPYTYVEKQYTGRTKEQFFLFWNEHKLQLPVEISFHQYDEVTNQDFLSLDVIGPQKMGKGTKMIREYQNFEHKYTSEQAENLLYKQLDEFIRTLNEKGVHIIGKNGKIDTSTGEWKLDVELLVQEYVDNG